MVDTWDLKSHEVNSVLVPVRVRSPAPQKVLITFVPLLIPIPLYDCLVFLTQKKKIPFKYAGVV